MMAGVWGCSFLWLCQLALLFLQISGGWSDVGSAAVEPLPPLIHSFKVPPGMPCGDGLCVCNQSLHLANCSGHLGNFTHAPKLPDDITAVILSHNFPLSYGQSENFFANLSQVTELDLSYSGMFSLSRETFKGMDRLKVLDLSGNIMAFSSITVLFSLPTVTSLTLQNCYFPMPIYAIFPKDSVVSYLNLNFNSHHRAYNLEGFRALPHLTTLHLCGLYFTDVFTVRPLQHLYWLHLDDNALNRFPNTCTGEGSESAYPALQGLWIRRNRIQALSTRQVCLPSLKKLDISFNLIKVYPAYTFSIMKFPQLVVLNLQYQFNYPFMEEEGEARIENYAFDNEKLEHLSLAKNGLDFTINENIGENAFANCSHLVYLDLSSNNFMNVDDQRFFQLFSHLRSLANLSLSNCQFDSFSTRTFASFPELGTLYLSGNMIADLPDRAFDALHRLDELFLHNNKIKTINEQTFGKQLRQRLTSLNLGFNPFFCSCDLLWFTNWYQTEQWDLFQQRTPPKVEYKCQNIPGMALANFSLTEQACVFNREVNLFLIQFCGVFIFILMLVSLIFRYRWYIRLLMYEVFRGRDMLRRQRLQANNFEFDVFVSYASEDAQWVQQQLMVKLEDELGLRLCVHERDFVPGRNIMDNIVQCVESSKKILMVFSENFVHSPWCQFELSLCLTHVLDYDDALVVVCVDEVTSRQMTSSMMAVLKTTTYIQWREEDEEAVASFWGRLGLAFQEILPLREHRV